MNWRMVGLVGVLAIGVGGCETLPTSGLMVDLLGEWEWVESTGGIAGVTNTPASTGHTQTLIFRPDGTLEIRRDGAPWMTLAFEIVSHSEPGEWELRYSGVTNGFDSQHVSVRRHLLVLTDPCCDGFVNRYVRVP